MKKLSLLLFCVCVCLLNAIQLTAENVSTPQLATTYTSAVPSQYDGVMLQGFYWESNSKTTYGRTKWSDLIAQSSELTSYFDLIWLPPSAKSGGGLGYHPKQWSNQNSDLGTAKELETLISQLHGGGTKVIADIVVNHRDNKSSWCDFYQDNFGDYGTFQLEAKHIVKNDEVNSSASAGSCRGAATGANDTGEQYAAARDLDHTNVYVQNAVKAYLKWMINEVGYDGFRYDVAKGFSSTYFGQYNLASSPFFSVGEYWDGNANTLKGWIDGTGKNSLVFDFATKYTAFNQGIAAGNYAKLKGSGLLGMGYSKYAVTFIDNHDTFERGNGSDFQSISSKEKILHANAFILSMPGVPCVFYPHWSRYKADLKPMIEARRAVGVHSESKVTDEYVAGNKYECTVHGTNGYLILRIGSGSAYGTTPAGGYTKAASGTNYAIYIKTNSTPAPRLTVNPAGGKYIGGTNVTLSATSGASIYYTLDGSEPTTSSTKYTSPLSIAEKEENTVLKAFAIKDGAKSEVQTHTYITYEAPRTEPITVRFKKPSDWSQVYLWAWTAAENLYPGGANPKWPGNTIKDEGNGWWSHTFDMAVNSVNIIFNNGASSNTQQTADIIDVTTSTSYTWGGQKNDPIVDHTGIEQPKLDTNLTLYPNPTQAELFIEQESTIGNLKLFMLDGTCIYEDNVDQRSIVVNVSHLGVGVYIVQTHNAAGEWHTARFFKNGQ